VVVSWSWCPKACAFHTSKRGAALKSFDAQAASVLSKAVIRYSFKWRANVKDDAEGAANEIEKIDLTDVRFKELARCASRIVPLLESAHNKGDKDMIAIFDDMLGVVYALIDAHKLNVSGKTGESDYSAIEKRSKQLRDGEVRRVGNWMAGFHFNNAIFRISAVFARLVIRFGGKPKEQDAREEAEKAFLKKKGAPWANKEANAVRKEVNTLKHEVGGVFKGRAEDLTTALTALDQLLTLAEALY